MSSLAKSFRGSKTKTKRDTVDSTLFLTDGETKIKLNPLSKGLSKEEFKNERRNGGGGGSTTREVEMTETSIEISNVIIETLKDDNGRRYSWNKVTNETEWIDEKKNEEPSLLSNNSSDKMKKLSKRNSFLDKKNKKGRRKRAQSREDRLATMKLK